MNIVKRCELNKMNRMVTATLMLSALFLDGAFAQSSSPVWKSAAGFDYYELTHGPASKSMPVLVVLHWSTSSPEEIIPFYDSLPKPVRIIALRGGYPKKGQYSFFPEEHYTRDSVTQAQTVRKTVDSVARFLTFVNKQYGVKPIITGASQGGDISLLIAIYYPQLIKASFPLLGFIHRSEYKKLGKPATKPVPVYMFQGEADKIVSIAYTKKEVTFLNKYYLVKLKSYPGIDHDIPFVMKHDYSVLIGDYLK